MVAYVALYARVQGSILGRNDPVLNLNLVNLLLYKYWLDLPRI